MLTDFFNIAPLHIESPERCFLRGKVIVYAFPLNRCYDDYLKVLIHALKDQMHIQFGPIAGSSRVNTMKDGDICAYY